MWSERGEAAGPGGGAGSRGGSALFLGATAATLALELWMAVRRFGYFGGYRHHRSVDTAPEYLVFFAALVLCHALLVFGLYAAVRRLHRGRGERLFRFNFLFFAGLLIAGAAVAKFKVLAYLSDATDLQTIRNLAGGSLAGALYYVLEETLVFLGAIAGAAGAWFLLYRLLRLRLRPGPPVAPAPGAGRRAWLTAAALAATPLVLLQAGRTGDSRIALERFNAPWLALAGLDAATDFDGDGYSVFSAQRDSYPFDPGRHPYALDVPGNGRDEDGLGGDFRYGGAPAPLPTPALGPERKHVVLIVLESVRADALTRHWDGRPVAPNLRALAARGSHAPEAWSHAGFTVQSLKSLFTGQLEPVPGDPSLFADFRKNGYRVATFSTQAADFGGVAAATGMRENSHVFVDGRLLEKERVLDFLRNVSTIVDGRTMLREMDRHFGGPESWRRPAFLYFNFQTAHFPYDFPGTPRFLPGPPIPRSKISRANRRWVTRSYWNAVAYADWLTGQVVARLKAHGAFDESIILVVGDHGEEVFEKGYVGHGQVLTRLQMQIPLVSNVAGLSLPRPTGLVDVRRILLNAAGAKLPEAPPRPVFHYTGEKIARPSSIGLAEAGLRLTSLRLDTEDVTFEDLGITRSYRDLPAGSALRRRADAVIDRWAEERWTQHLRMTAARARRDQPE